jgi:signal transduction histidine kinase/ligand-binding sensor domain-containing protein
MPPIPRLPVAPRVRSAAWRTFRHASLAARGLAILLALSHLAGAQTSRFRLDHFNIEDGLAQNWVKQVTQDRAGFLWVGTSKGLQRYDGYSFVPLSELDQRGQEGPAGLIMKIVVDRRDVPWIETEAGLFRYDRAARRSERIATDSVRTHWAVDSSGRTWLLDGATLKVIDAGASVPRVHRQMGDSLSGPIFAEGQSVWIAAVHPPDSLVNRTPDPARLVRIDLTSGATQSLTLREMAYPLAFVRDGQGSLWISGADGLEWLPRDGDTFVSIPEFRGRLIIDVEVDDEGRLLVLTDRALSRLSDRGKILAQWAPGEIFDTGLPQDVFEDAEGGIWVGTVTAGLFRLDLRPSFEHLSSRSNPPFDIAGDFVLAIAERSDGSLFIGTLRNGAVHVTSDGRRLRGFRHLPGRQDGLPSDDVWRLQEDRAGNMWIGTGGGICKVGERSQLASCHPTSLSSLAIDDNGQFWLMRGDNVASFDPESGKLGTPLPVVGEEYSVHADSGHLWIGGTVVYRAALSNGRIVGPLQHLATTTRGRRVWDFHRDEHNVLWLGSEAGLLRWEAERNAFEPVRLPDLQNITVFSIEGDGRGRLWLGTSHGLVQYTPQRGLVRRFRREDGVLNAEFNRQASLRRRNGEMLFGGVDGITRFHPDSLSIDGVSPPLVFTNWRKVTKDGLTRSALDGVRELRLNPGDRAFTIEFAALTFAAGSHRQYRFRLEGMSDGWIESSDRVVTYATPPPGKYVFRVQSSARADGSWHEPGASIDLVVVPAFWATTWFRVLMAGVFVSLLWGLHLLRLQRAVETERIRLQISRDLHDEIGAGLSSIALMSDSVTSGSRMTAGDGSQLQMIARTARDMVADLRDIVWAIDPDSDRLSDVVSRMRDTASTLLRDVNITFDVNPQRDLSRVIGMAARRDLFLIFKELLHNVARHSGARNVRIDLQAIGQEIRLVIADDGVGFAPGRGQSGTGLKSMRERAARLGGDLQLSSEPGKGTTATLRVRTT